MKKVIKFTIDKEGQYQMECLEGFSGTSCTDQTRGLELILGGTVTGEGKTDSYYDPDSPISINTSL